MISSFRRLPLVAVGVASASWCAFAQDGKADPVKPQDSAPPAVEAGKPDATALLARMEMLYPKVLQRPVVDSAAINSDQKAIADAVKRQQEWDASVAALAKAGDQYVAALAGAAPEPRGLFFRGIGNYLWSTRNAPDVRKCREAAVDSLQKYLDAADAKASFRADAELRLGETLMLLAPSDPKRFDEAVVHLRRAVDLLQKDGRHDDAGKAAYSALAGLKENGRDADLRAFADGVHAADADFGASTKTVRGFAAAAKFAVGSPLPALPDVKDADGKPISFAPGGKPFVLHFFYTTVAGTGEAAPYREVDAEIRPLWEKHHEKGLRFIGVCMDYAMPKERADARRKAREDAGQKGEFRDGSLESDREWAKRHGIEWQWSHSGVWTNDPVSMALGNAGRDGPFAVLVDKDGVVRWKGDAPFEGLAGEIAKLVP